MQIEMNNSYIKINCEDETIYKNETVVEYIDYVFNRPEVISRGRVIEQVGNALTTCGMNSDIIMTMPGIQNLIQWIANNLILNANIFTSEEVKGVNFTRAWMNKMFRGCSGEKHFHQPVSNGTVSIFYFNVPENGSKFVIHHENEDEEVEVKTGDLIIHDSQLIHSVTEHKSDIPRICFIFESNYV